MICLLSPDITLEDIQYPEMREVLQNVTYLQWPPKRRVTQTSNTTEFKHFWQKLYTNIVMGSKKTYPNISVLKPNRNIPV